MKTFKNTHFIKRHTDSVTVVFCQAETAPSENYTEVDELDLDLSDCQQLWIENNVKYFGYL